MTATEAARIESTTAGDRMRSARATRRDRRVQLAAHPLALPALRLVPGPARRIPGLGVVVSDLRLVREALVRSDEFRKNGPGTSSDLWTPILGESVLLNMSGAPHAELRAKLQPLFAPGFVAALAERSLAPQLDDLRARLGAGERVDVVRAAHRCSSSVIAQLVGLPAERIHDDALYREINEISSGITLRSLRLTGARLARAREIVASLTAHAADAYRRGDVGTIPGRMRDLGLDEREALGAVGAFALTGTETLTAYIPRLVALLVDSGWMRRVADDRSLLEPAINEGLRVASPVLASFRHVRVDARLGPMRVRAGERLILLNFRGLQAAGPFDPARNRAADLKRLWFGAGAHFCLGAPLAMAQMRLVLGALLDATDTAGPLRIHSRRAARGVLIPAYRALEVAALGAAP